MGLPFWGHLQTHGIQTQSVSYSSPNREAMDTDKPLHDQLHILGFFFISVAKAQSRQFNVDNNLERIVSLAFLSQPLFAHTTRSRTPARSSHRMFPRQSGINFIDLEPKCKRNSAKYRMNRYRPTIPVSQIQPQQRLCNMVLSIGQTNSQSSTIHLQEPSSL
jgi:hypothetical protein